MGITKRNDVGPFPHIPECSTTVTKKRTKELFFFFSYKCQNRMTITRVQRKPVPSFSLCTFLNQSQAEIRRRWKVVTQLNQLGLCKTLEPPFLLSFRAGIARRKVYDSSYYCITPSQSVGNIQPYTSSGWNERKILSNF